jgi:NAD(P)H dehydrogenase (quinone)
MLLLRLRRSLLTLLLLTVAAAAQPVGVLITYDSVDGHTEKLAGWIAEGVREDKEAEIRLKRVEETSVEDLLWADAILLGSPVYNGGMTPAVAKFIAEWPFDGSPLKNKAGGAFVSSKGASSGEETTMLAVLHSMLVMQMLTFGGDDWRTGYGVSYLRDLTVDPKILEFTRDKAIRMGRRAVMIARVTKPLRVPLPRG